MVCDTVLFGMVMARWHAAIPMTVQWCVSMIWVCGRWYGIVWYVMVRYRMTGYGYDIWYGVWQGWCSVKLFVLELVWEFIFKMM